MDKKNTMLLTVIAVATLLVAVVGATFAYFTATATQDDQTTVVTADTETVAAITLTNPTDKLNINLTAIDMAQDNQNTYYATANTVAKGEEGYKPYETFDVGVTPTQRQIAVATVGEGGSTTAKYQCTATLTVTLSGSMVEADETTGEIPLKAGDAFIQFGGLLNEKVDLTAIDADGYDVTFNLNGGDTTELDVTAAVAIVNRDAGQNSIAGKDLTVTFAALNTEDNKFACQVVK